MASAKKKPDDALPQTPPVSNTDTAAAATAMFQQFLDEFVKNNPPVATMPAPADIKPTGNTAPPVDAPPTNPQPAPAPVSQQPQVQQQTVGDFIDSILNKGQILTGPAGSGGGGQKSGGGLNDIIGKITGGQSGTKDGSLGSVGKSISGVGSLLSIFGL